MRFDVVIIGGGLAGLTAGIRLQRAGKSCALVHAGQSALHFSSGSLDFLNRLPGGESVNNPEAALPALAEAEPMHPYSLLGVEKTLALAGQAQTLLDEAGAGLCGSLAQGNHQRMTPLGALCPTWLSSRDVAVAPAGAMLPYERVLVLNIEGFLDFYPEILADRLERLGVESECRQVSLPALEVLRKNPTEFRSVNLARVIDLPENLELLAERLIPLAEHCQAVLMPACIGHKDSAPLDFLRKALGKPVFLIPTLPPSMVGARLSHRLIRAFLEAGGLHMPGDKALGYTLREGVISRLFTANHEDVPLEAEAYILASGSFFSQGLKADQNDVREAVFNLDLHDLPASRERWTAESVFAPQPYARFGVKTDARMRVFIDNKRIDNLFAAGMVIGQYDAVRLGCGGGVALVTALAAAEGVLNLGGAA